MSTKDFAVCGDLKLLRENPKSDYDIIWTPTFIDRMLILATQC